MHEDTFKETAEVIGHNPNTGFTILNLCGQTFECRVDANGPRRFRCSACGSSTEACLHNRTARRIRRNLHTLRKALEKEIA